MKTESWATQRSFLFATVSCSIGLGNLWRFPYIAGENGGGAFVLVYIGFVLLVGVPLVMVELAIARRGHRSPVDSTASISQEESGHRRWQLIGWLSILAPLLALSFYGVVGGWSLDYMLMAAFSRFEGIQGEQAGALFAGVLDSPERMLMSFSAMLVAVAIVVGSGIRRGIERASAFMMPALFVLLVVLAAYALGVGDAGRGLAFLFQPDFSSLSADGVLMALGQALLSLAVGTGALLAYGAYLPKEVSIPVAAWTVALADTGAALLAGLVIFPLVFASGLDSGEGPGLTFVILPLAFSEMPGGNLFACLFFLLVFFAAFTSGMGMMEPFVSWLEERRGWTRPKAAVLTTVLVWCLGLSAVFSFNLWSDFTPLDMIPALEGRTVFSILDYVVSNFFLPLNALLIALMAGWAIDAGRLRTEIGLEPGTGWHIFLVSVRYLAPLAVFSTFLFNLAG